MGKSKGWIKYWRKSADNEMYFSGPFDEWHAWIDLLTLAEYEKVNGRYEGRLKTTYNALNKRWGWDSYKRVRAYLGRLKGRLMIDMKPIYGKGGGILIIIENYDLYQQKKNSKKPAEKSEKGQIKGQVRRNTSLYPTRIYKEEGIFESSPEGDSKTPSEENNSSGSGVMSPEAFMRKLEAEKEKEGNGDI